VRPYEIAIIFDASLEETVIRERIDGIVSFVRSRGGTPGHVDRWGRRPFAYELKHRNEGYYVFIEVTGEPALLAEVDRMLSLTDEVLRHRVLRRPEGVATRRRTPTPAPAAPAVVGAAAEPQDAPAE
jgi:small subunit ribosomal protein S6